MTSPIWFLDIDGVVNAAGLDLPPHLVRTDATTAGTTWPIHYSPQVVEFINMVHRGGLAEVRWLTTWGQDARMSFALVEPAVEPIAQAVAALLDDVDLGAIITCQGMNDVDGQFVVEEDA